ncbi:MAG: sodium/proline symporter [Candidatus Electryonea clarkiae]|nr:sodium/proline symporter [Candidatus Electryonea clarkiae]MDP8285291.1 sodium/proline symporter [Candidatus Electryonea clarkiae]
MVETDIVKINIDVYALSAFIGYLVIIIAIGIFTSRFSSGGITEYFLAGRKLNRFVVALSAVVSGRSAWLLLGFTGMAYKMGASALWAAVGYIVVEFFLFFFYAERLRNFSEHYDCITITDFYAERLEDKKGSLRILISVIFLLFLTSYVSAQFVGGGKAFASSFGLNQSTGMLLTAGIVLIYTILGGFLAVSLTDLLQAIFMILALIILPVVAIINLGGFGVLLQELTALQPSYIDPFAITAGALIGFVGIGLGSPGNPHILVRYMSIDDPKQLKISAIVGTGWNIVMAIGALFIGLAGRVYFPEASTLPGGDAEQLYPALAKSQLHPVLFGIVIASIFAAIMSTADSQLLVATSSVVIDIYKRILHKNDSIPQKKLVLISRVVVLILVVIAVLFGIVAGKLVFWLVLFAWAGLGASIGPTSILALFWRRTTRAGVFAGLLAGTGTTITWYYIPALKGFMYELIPGFFVGLLMTFVVSLITKRPIGTEKMFEIMKAGSINESSK